LEFDFNAAELRVLLGLLEKEQPQQDIHEWNINNVYRGLITREDAKKGYLHGFIIQDQKTIF
jgi:hypothetical protein